MAKDMATQLAMDGISLQKGIPLSDDELKSELTNHDGE
jgi:hypothetical protein